MAPVGTDIKSHSSLLWLQGDMTGRVTFPVSEVRFSPNRLKPEVRGENRYAESTERNKTRGGGGERIICTVFVSCFIWMNETLSVTKMT